MEFIEFESDGRTLTCRRASSPATPGTVWWWLAVSTETQRYAAFRAEPTDTPANVRPRIEAYYTKLLEDRAKPREFHPKMWRRPVPAQSA